VLIGSDIGHAMTNCGISATRQAGGPMPCCFRAEEQWPLDASWPLGGLAICSPRTSRPAISSSNSSAPQGPQAGHRPAPGLPPQGRADPRSPHLCWLALLLIRVTEITTRATWPAIRRDLQRIALGTFTGPSGPSASAPSCPRPRATPLTQLKIDPPPGIYRLTTPAP